MSNSDIHDRTRRMTFRERLAWLGRMPTHYKILFGSQLMITIFAIRMRYKLVQRQKERDEAFSVTPTLTDEAHQRQ
jgi:hypothetical protein